MPAEKFHNKYRIASARAPWHDYNGGAYFITINTRKHQCFFGNISNNEMHFSTIGQYADENLKNITVHYPYAEIVIFQVMPNHVHAIVIIDGNKIATTAIGRDAARHVSTDTDTDTDTGKNAKMQDIANQSGLLSVCMGGFKSAVTKFANENKIEFSWQTRFHDHIIRDQNEMNRIAEYIENNVARWESDKFYTENL